MPGLDGLRGVAILMVILTHAANGWGAAQSISQNTMNYAETFKLPDALRSICGSAVNGVMLFFLVSAFTLTCSCMNRSESLSRYGLKRIARVGPGYWIAGLAYTLWVGGTARLWAPDGVSWPDYVTAFSFSTVLQGGAAYAVVPGGWSVSNEVLFYAVLPVLLATCGRRPWTASAITVCAFAVAQGFAWFHIHHGSRSFYKATSFLEQLPVFCLGFTAALFMRRIAWPQVPMIGLAAIAVAVLLLPLCYTWHAELHLQFSVIAVVAVCATAACPSRIVNNAVMTRIGQVSYSMYLIHFAVLRFSLAVAERILPSNDTWTMLLHFAMTASVTFLLACVTYTIVEEPCIRWAHRHAPKAKLQPAG